MEQIADDHELRQLVGDASRGDDAAARRLVQQLYPLVAKIVRAHRPQRAAEEDLCQMIFVKMFQHLDQYSGAAPLQHWLSRIAVNTCRNALASEKARPELRRADLSEEQEAVLDQLARTSDELAPDQQLASREVVERLLSALKPVERLIIDMLYLQGISVEQIAKAFGWSKSLVKVRAFRARQKLKQHLSRIQREGT